jgi:hypothetical protein
MRAKRASYPFLTPPFLPHLPIIYAPSSIHAVMTSILVL